MLSKVMLSKEFIDRMRHMLSNMTLWILSFACMRSLFVALGYSPRSVVVDQLKLALILFSWFFGGVCVVYIAHREDRIS